MSNCKYILAAVDGTGSRETAKIISQTKSNSSVGNFYYNFKTNFDKNIDTIATLPISIRPTLYTASKAYWHGPGNPGMYCKPICDSVVTYVAHCWRKIQDQSTDKNEIKVCLIGHSRGAHILTAVASKLQSYNIPVYFMGMYDSVDMDVTILGNTKNIHNVQHVYHARRDPILLSRAGWGNTSTSNVGGSYQEQFFITSHGGVGGDFVQKFDSLEIVKHLHNPQSLTIIDDQTCLIDFWYWLYDCNSGNSQNTHSNNNLSTPNGWIIMDLEIKKAHPYLKQHIQQKDIKTRWNGHTYRLVDLPNLVKTESDAADNFIRTGARRCGLQV